MSGCCSSCGAAVIWAVMPSGKRHPFDPIKTTTGQRYRIIEGKAEFISAKDQERLGNPSHFASCPDAEQHRKRAR